MLPHDVPRASQCHVAAAACAPLLDTGGAPGDIPGEHEIEDEEEQEYMVPTGPEEHIVNNTEFRKGYVESVFTMCLVGGAFLPVPWAFSRTGVLAGTLVCLLVGGANLLTTELLIRQCYKTGARNYEDLAFAVGGEPWLMVTRISILVLMFGTTVGTIQQIGEAAAFGLTLLWPHMPAWLLYSNTLPNTLMALFTFLIAYPLCSVQQLRFMGFAGLVGSLLVGILLISLVLSSAALGFPAITSGDLLLLGFDDINALADAVSVFGFAFYLQPLVMPLFNEMPGQPRHRARITTWSLRMSMLIFCVVMYLPIGFFGAALFGQKTEENILQNELLGGGAAQGILNVLMAVYLTLAIPTTEFPMRDIIMHWLPGPEDYSPLRHFLVTTLLIVLSFVVAIVWGSGSGTFIVLTGATGVLLACYVVPIANHYMLYFKWARCQQLGRVGSFRQFTKTNALDHVEGLSTETLSSLNSNRSSDNDLSGSMRIIKPLTRSYSKRKNTIEGFMWDAVIEVSIPLVVAVVGTASSFMVVIAAFKSR